MMDKLLFENSDNESIFDMVFGRALQLNYILNSIIEDRINGLPLKEIAEIYEFNGIKLCMEIDQLKREYPDSYKKYLKVLKKKYLKLQESKNKCDKNMPEYLSEEDLLPYYHISDMFDAIDYVIDHLEGLLTPETETQKQPKTTAAPKGQTQLNRNQTGLLFWYLRERSLILPKVENQNIGKAIELMTGHSAGIMADILKKPQTDVCKLGKDKPVNKNDFDTVIAELDKLISRIKTDRRTNVENGELN